MKLNISNLKHRQHAILTNLFFQSVWGHLVEIVIKKNKIRLVYSYYYYFFLILMETQDL